MSLLSRVSLGRRCPAESQRPGERADLGDVTAGQPMAGAHA